MSDKTVSSSTPSSHSTNQPERRSVLKGVLAGVIALVLGLVPLGAGLLVLLDPLRKRKGSAGSDDGRPGQWIRVASLDALPTNGTPVQTPVTADLVDAWNRTPNQPIGAVYLRRSGETVEAFNAICPHAGCFVAYAEEDEVYRCPCHTSSFSLEGEIIQPSPSPRDMDRLEVDASLLQAGEVWVRFVNYYPGKHERIAKA